MSTEGGRRVPKPPINFGTHLLIEFIPLLNCDPGKPGEMIGHIVSRVERWAGVHSDFIWRWAENQEAIDGIRETQADIKTLLVDPINQPIIDRMNEFVSRLSPVIKAGGEFGGGAKINLDLKSLKTDLQPRESNRGDRGFFMGDQGFKDFDRIWIPGFRAMLYATVAAAFETATIDRKKSIVSAYIGSCPRCGTIFEKTLQSNQVFCSGACKQADYRARKKLVTKC